MEYVSTERLGEHAFGVVVRLVIWEQDQIRDVKEQMIGIRLDAIDEARFERVTAMLRAQAQVIGEALATQSLDQLMPHDLLDFSVLELSRAETEEDFAKALRRSGRLGKFL